MDETGQHNVEQTKPSSKSQTLHVFTHVKSRPKMMMVMMVMGREGKRGTIWGMSKRGEGGRRGS
jgi:hypothetical protein